MYLCLEEGKKKTANQLKIPFSFCSRQLKSFLLGMIWLEQVSSCLLGQPVLLAKYNNQNKAEQSGKLLNSFLSLPKQPIQEVFATHMPLNMRQISLPAASSIDDALRAGCLGMITGNRGIKFYLYMCSKHS